MGNKNVVSFSRFNSKLVRLKARAALQSFQGVSQFQFQTGSIKSPPDNRSASTPESSFNSKLVRLKVRTRRTRWMGFRMFQFQTGSIKRDDERGCADCDSRFQFQTGSIKSQSVRSTQQQRSPVSIPNWFD